jgi:hypothetical protein
VRARAARNRWGGLTEARVCAFNRERRTFRAALYKVRLLVPGLGNKAAVMSKLLVTVPLALVAGVLGGLLLGIAPCYLFGGGNWCGFKSEPPHFFLQFAIGALLAVVLVVYRRHRR